MKVDLRGKLNPEKFSQVLTSLKENQYYGTVVVSDGLREKCFFFTRGGLRLATSNGKSVELLQFLWCRGLLPREAIPSLQAEATRPDRSLKSVVCANAKIDTGVYDDVERELMVSEFLETLIWPDAHFEMSIGDPEQEAYQSELQTRRLSIGIGRMIEELLARAITVREPAKLMAEQNLFNLTDAGRRALKSATDEPTRDLMGALAGVASNRFFSISDRLPWWQDFELALRLKGLIDRGWLVQEQRALSEDEGLELDRIRSMEESLDTSISPIMRRQALARSYIDQGDKSAGARHHKRAGLLLLNSDRAYEASKELREAYHLTPDDFEAHEGFVEALWSSQQSEPALKETELLAQRYFDLGLINRARLVLEKPLERRQKTLEIQSMLAKAYLRLGRSDKALEVGRGLCEELRAAGRSAEAMELAEKFVSAGVDRRRVSIMTGEQRRRRIRRGLYIAAGVLAVALYPSFVVARAHLDFRSTLREAQALVAQGRYEAAKDRLEELLEDNPYSGLEFQVDPMVTEINTVLGERRALLKLFENWVEGDRINWNSKDAPDLSRAVQLIEDIRKGEGPEIPPGQFTAASFDDIEANLQNHLSQAATLRERFKDAQSIGNHKLAYDLSARFYNSYRKVDSARASFRYLGIPVLITSDPPGARIEGLKKPATAGEPVYIIPPDEAVELTLRLEGYKPLKVKLDPVSSGFAPKPFRLEPLGG